MRKLTTICAITGLLVLLTGCAPSTSTTADTSEYTKFAKTFIETTNSYTTSTDTSTSELQQVNDKFKDKCTESIYKGYLDLSNTNTRIRYYGESDTDVTQTSKLIKSGVISSDDSGVSLINLVEVTRNSTKSYQSIYTKISKENGKLKLVKLKTYNGKTLVL